MVHRCQCSPPANVTQKMEQDWNQTGYSPDSVPWSSLSVSVRPHTPWVTQRPLLQGEPQFSYQHWLDELHCNILTFLPQMCKKLHGQFVGAACGHHGPYIPDVLFWSIILFFTTFFLSSFLKQFKFQRYFPTKVMKISLESEICYVKMGSHVALNDSMSSWHTTELYLYIF